jgi:predicted metal-dependent hydrolase
MLYLLQMTETPVPRPQDCTGTLHPMAIKGIMLFNRGEYWNAHEALEEAWREETGEVRYLYQGVLQVGVAYLHIQRGNFNGAIKLHRRAHRWLDPFPAQCRGIDVACLMKDLDAAIAEVRRLGPARLASFNLELLKPVQISL